MRPTRRGIIFAGVGFFFALLPSLVSENLWSFWSVYCGVVVFAFGFDALLSTPRRRVEIDLAVPQVLYIGEQDAAEIQLRMPNITSFDVMADLSKELVRQPVTSSTTSSQDVRVSLPLVPRRRGVAEIESIWVRYPGPFRLIERTKRHRAAQQIPVVPNIVPTRQTALRFLSDPSYRVGLKIERYEGDGTEFESLREFVYGDDDRTIDWRSTARHRRLLCRHFRAERNHQIVLAVDTGHLMSEPLDSVPKVDHAVSSALLLAYVGLKSGDRVGLFTFDARVGNFMAPEGGVSCYHKLTHIASRIDYTEAETNFTLGLTTLGEKLKRRSLVVVFTDFVDTVTAELMLENLSRVARKHVVIFVSLRDPQLGALARAHPGSILALNRAVVASAQLRERHHVMRRLERQGLFTIDTEPSRMGSEIINRYLEVKRRELI